MALIVVNSGQYTNRCIVGWNTIELSFRGQHNVIPTETSGRHSAFARRKAILIADDSKMVRTLIRQELERDTDFEVCGEAVDGAEAVSKAQELSPDLIILDVRMPGLNGMEVAGILRYAQPRIRIVLVTLYAEDIGNNFTSVFRIDAVLTKANGLTDLTAHVRNLLTDRQVRTDSPRDCEVYSVVQQKPKQLGSRYWEF
jgi:DNA-binding NarL/FixJ family response regulator